MESHEEYAGEHEAIMPHTILLGDSPKRNKVQKFLRDMWGLTQDADSGNLVVGLILSNLAALAKHIKTLRGDQRRLARNTSANGDQLDEHEGRIRRLERSLAFYEKHVESMRHYKPKLERELADDEAPSKIVPPTEMEVQEMCFLCGKPLEKGQLVTSGEAVNATTGEVRSVIAHAACASGATPLTGLVDAGGNSIKSEAQDTSRSLSHMDDMQAEEGEG